MPEKSELPSIYPLDGAHPQGGIGVYVHFPWCLQKCPYCDFLSVAVKSPQERRPATRAEATAAIAHAAYADAVIAELHLRFHRLYSADAPGEMPALRSIFFGGGTPSLWAPDQVRRVIAAILDLFGTSQATRPEITVECNPTSVDLSHFEALTAAGVTRVSIGVQSLDTQRLEFLGRLHDESRALDAIAEARAAGVPLVSADLIYGVFRQSPEQAVREVTTVAGMGVDHLSAYMLTIEENTRFGAQHRQGKLPLLDDALVAESFSAVSSTLQNLGFEHYEVSNFAKAGCRSIHNDGYWLGRDYLGLGTGAYGTVTVEQKRLRYRNFISPERYVEVWRSAQPENDPFDTLSVEQEEIDPETCIQEAILLGLRRKEGIDLCEIARVRGAVDPLASRQGAIDKLTTQRKLKRVGNQLMIPSSYWLFADQIIRELL